MSGETAKGSFEASALPPSSSGTDDHSTGSARHEIELEDYHSRSHTSSIADHDEEKNAPEPEPLQRASTELGPPVTVPRLKRRGLLGQFALVAEIENPKTYPRRMKWFITFIVAVAGAAAPLGSSIFFRKSLRHYQYLPCSDLIDFLQPRSPR